MSFNFFTGVTLFFAIAFVLWYVVFTIYIPANVVHIFVCWSDIGATWNRIYNDCCTLLWFVLQKRVLKYRCIRYVCDFRKYFFRIWRGVFIIKYVYEKCEVYMINALSSTSRWFFRSRTGNEDILILRRMYILGYATRIYTFYVFRMRM